VAIERAGLSETLNVKVNDAAPVFGTRAGQDRAAPGEPHGKPRRRDPAPEKDAAEPLAEVEDTERSPHRVDRLA
jgi:hypothetical protein